MSAAACRSRSVDVGALRCRHLAPTSRELLLRWCRRAAPSPACPQKRGRRPGRVSAGACALQGHARPRTGPTAATEALNDTRLMCVNAWGVISCSVLSVCSLCGVRVDPPCSRLAARTRMHHHHVWTLDELSRFACNVPRARMLHTPCLLVGTLGLSCIACISRYLASSRLYLACLSP